MFNFVVIRPSPIHPLNGLLLICSIWCRVWDAAATRVHYKNLDLKSVQVSLLKSLTRIAKGECGIELTRLTGSVWTPSGSDTAAAYWSMTVRQGAKVVLTMVPYTTIASPKQRPPPQVNSPLLQMQTYFPQTVSMNYHFRVYQGIIQKFVGV